MKDKSQEEVHVKMKLVYGHESMLRTTIHGCVNNFQSGRTNVMDEKIPVDIPKLIHKF